MERPVYYDGHSGIPAAWFDPNEPVINHWYNIQDGRRLPVTRYTTLDEVVEELGEIECVGVGPQGGPKYLQFADTRVVQRRLILEAIEKGHTQKVDREAPGCSS